MKNLTFFNEENTFIDKRQTLTMPNVSFTKDSGLSWLNESYILASYYVDTNSAVTSTYNMRMMSAMPSKPKFPINDPNIVDVGNGDLKKIVYNGEGDEQTVDLVDLPKMKYIPSGEIINRGEFVENPINPFPVMMLDDGTLYETNTVYGTINYSFYRYVISSDYSESCIIDKQIQSLIITVDEELNPKNSYRLLTFNPSTDEFITRNDERFIPEIVDSTHLSLTSEQITKINDLISANGSIILVLDKYIGDETIIESYEMMNSTFTIDGVYMSSTSDTKLTPAITKGKITKILKTKRNPYLLEDGNIGWVNDSCIISCEEANKEIYHTVVKYDTLWNLAQRYYGSGLKYPEIKKLNNLKSDTIYIGQRLRIK